MSRETHPRTAFGNTSIAAQTVLRGPHGVVVDSLNGQRFYGWSNLALQTRDWQSVRAESRSLYANLFDKSQKSAILRAVYWDAPLARGQVKAHPRTFRLALPARFVAVSVRQLKAWLAEFGGIRIKLPGVYERDETVDVKRIRIERDYLSQVFENAWQTRDREHTVLNEKWDRVWKQMTRALISAPTVDTPDEDFWFITPTVRYDLSAYQPDWYVPSKRSGP